MSLAPPGASAPPGSTQLHLLVQRSRDASVPGIHNDPESNKAPTSSAAVAFLDSSASSARDRP